MPRQARLDAPGKRGWGQTCLLTVMTVFIDSMSWEMGDGVQTSPFSWA
jgi:hypothetical protein